MIKVSIIVPVYNTEKFLDKCLISLINQTLKDCEVIVINDGSTDKSIDIIEKFQEKYPNIIKVFSKENGGLSSARNYGLKQSRGKYIMFVDSDDTIENTMAEDLYRIIENDRYDVVISDYYLDYGNEKTPVTNNIEEGIVSGKEYLMLPVMACSKIYRREFLIDNNYNYPDKLWYEDLATNPQIAIYTDKIYYLKKPLYNYLQRSESIMNNKKFNPKMLDIIQVMNIIEKDFIKKKAYTKYKGELEYLYIEHLLHNASLRFLKFDNYKENIRNINVIIKDKYPNWRKNSYYKNKDLKYRIVCNLIYYGMFKLLKLVLKNK